MKWLELDYEMTPALTVETLYYGDCYSEAHICNHIHTQNYRSLLQKNPVKETLFTQVDKVSWVVVWNEYGATYYEKWGTLYSMRIGKMRPIAFGVLFYLNLQSQSPWSLFNGTWWKRPRELDHRLRFENGKILINDEMWIELCKRSSTSILIWLSRYVKWMMRYVLLNEYGGTR